jgi:hypothetical protein
VDTSSGRTFSWIAVAEELGAPFLHGRALNIKGAVRSNGRSPSNEFLRRKPPSYAVDEFLKYYYGERNHQGFDGKIINATKSIGSLEGKLHRKERLTRRFAQLFLPRCSVTDSNFWPVALE